MSAERIVGSERAGSGAWRAALPDGRWHFQHGPIDLIIAVDGERGDVEAAIARMWSRFAGLLSELVSELPQLRMPLGPAAQSAAAGIEEDRSPARSSAVMARVDAPRGSVARRMTRACYPHADRFITPMAAVAGAVADELIEIARKLPGVRRAYVNNGGDIALHLTQGEQFSVGMVCGLDGGGRPGAHGESTFRGMAPALDGTLRIDFASGVCGVATSGWRGRSFSLGIADAVTVLAACAADADAAATMIANAVNVDDPAIVRVPASRLKDDTDLGDRLVTTEVGRLTPAALNRALDSGEGHARALVDAGAVVAAALVLQGQVRLVAASDDIRSQLRLG